MNTIIDFLINGITGASALQVTIFTLVVTHITIASVTIYLHRHQAHRALDLHPIAAHFFRFWLWLTTGQVTKEWAAIHRKHHAKCEREGDPHSPVVFGIKKVLLEGAELYRAEAKNQETMQRYGHGTPDDWIEKNLYTKHTAKGIFLMLAIDIALFGVLGLTVWAVQMAWIPITAAGIINGLGHFAGYRNFDCEDASTNLIPWGIIIGGEELHNNHHTYPTSAKLSNKWYEFDIGWLYIQTLSAFGLAQVKKTPPKLTGHEATEITEKTVAALSTLRYEIMASFWKAIKQEMSATSTSIQKKTKALLKVNPSKLSLENAKDIGTFLDLNATIKKMYSMREELRNIWANQSISKEEAVAALKDWCDRAERANCKRMFALSRKIRMISA